jgi:DnaJ domain
MVNLHERRMDKWKVHVQVELTTGASLLGYLFIIPNQQRISDLLNDERIFLPFLGVDGVTRILRTSAIASVTELSQEARGSAYSDPYDVLGVSRSIDDQELSKIYKDLCRSCHPDRLASFGLPPEVVMSAHTMTVRVIDAYGRIVKERKDAKSSAGQ